MISFKCTQTGKEFLIDRYKAKVNTSTGQVEYFESKPGWPLLVNPKPGWTLLVNPKTGATLIKSDTIEIQMTSVKTDTASR